LVSFTSSLPQRGWQILGANLNCAESGGHCRLPTGCLNVKLIGMDPPHPLIRQTGIVELRKAIARPVRAM